MRALLAELRGTPKLVASILYGSGLRLIEACTLRVKDADLGARMITVRSGKGAKDRRTMLPESLRDPPREQIELVRRLHREDLDAGFGEV